METNYCFYFDYIYFRITQAFFKWDGRTGATGIIAITMVQLLLLMDFFVFIMRIFYDRNETKNHLFLGKFVILVLYAILFIYNYRKYNGKYNKLRFYWKDEPRRVRIYKGFLVIISLVLPWIPIILIGTLM
jgi:membrane protein YdbS with pleckstrin-like domain